MWNSLYSCSQPAKGTQKQNSNFGKKLSSIKIADHGKAKVDTVGRQRTSQL